MSDQKGYKTGADFWRDTVVRHGIEEAFGICGRYLGTQLQMELPDDEKQFCRELFTAMFEASADRTDPAKLVYPYPIEKAKERMETSYYHDSRKRNAECARAIDDAIHASCYKPNYYNLEVAAMKIIHDFGFTRVNLMLARQIQRADWDGRYSRANKEWAKGFTLEENAFNNTGLNAHPILIDDFVKYTRKLYADLGAEHFALPGRPESGEFIHGYEIIRAVTFDDQRGFAIGLNPEAVSQFVAWQFTVENGARDYYWGAYTDELQDAADNYLARVIVHLSDGDVKEVQRPFVAVKAPEFEREEKPSVLKQIREAKQAPKPPRKEKAPGHRKNNGDIEM